MFRGFSQDSDAPITRFEQMLKTNDVYFFDAIEFETIVQFYIDSGEQNLAKKALEMALNQHPYHIDLLLLKSELLIFDNEYKTAEEVLNFVEELEPSNQEIYIQKATICSKNKKHKNAIALLNKVIEFTDDPYEIWCLLGIEYMVLENYTEAKEAFKKCILEDINDLQVMFNLLLCLDYLKAHQEAVEVLNAILAKDPYNEIAWVEIGKQYLHLDLKEEALGAFDFAIISEDSFTGAYIEKGKLLEQLGRINLAIESYEIALQLDDPSSFLHLRIADCHAALGNNALAVQHYKQSINQDPSYEKAWTGIIDFYIENTDPEKALYYTDKALNINDNYIAYWKRSALLNKTLGKYAEAEIAFQNTIELGNYELAIWEAWLDTLAFLNEWEKGYTIGQQAKEFYSNETGIDVRLAGFYLHIGKTIEAEYYLKNVADIDNALAKELSTLFPYLLPYLK